MTNEFAIKVLTELKGYGDKFANIGFDRKEALDLAIKALEQQPCEDAVSRAEVNALYVENRPYLATHVSEFGDKLKKLPSVTPSAQAWLSTFNTDSATECFTAVQELKKRLEGEE